MTFKKKRILDIEIHNICLRNRHRIISSEVSGPLSTRGFSALLTSPSRAPFVSSLLRLYKKSLAWGDNSVQC
jgi:hypothetical protein